VPATTSSRATDRADAGGRAKRTKKQGGPSPSGKAAQRKPSRVDRAEARRRERIQKMRAKSGNRYRIHYDIDGPRVRLGVAWFVGAMVAFALGTVGVALYFGVAFAAAGSHALRTWRARGAAVDPRVALVSVAVVIAGAAVHPRLMGVGVLLLAVAAVGLAAQEVGVGPGALARASLVLQTALPTAVAGGCLVLLVDVEPWAALALVLLTSAYETGDYLIGSGALNAVEGPLAGGVAVLVVTLAVAALGFPPFGLGQAVVFGLLVGPGAFAGQILASAILPHSRAFAPALRRVDSLLIVAPLWYVGVNLLVR
jgi:hypothetical protein